MGGCATKQNVKTAQRKGAATQLAKAIGGANKRDYYLSCDQVAMLMKTCKPGELLILDSSVKPDSDNFKIYQEKHLPGAKYLDLCMCKDLASPYPFMMP